MPRSSKLKEAWQVNGESLLSRIAIDQNVLCGKPVVKGTRISVEMILEKLAKNMSTKDIMSQYDIEEQDIRAALTYAQMTLANEEVYDVI
jgi:uncharacterized protein (DUF433 family)